MTTLLHLRHLRRLHAPTLVSLLVSGLICSVLTFPFSLVLLPYVASYVVGGSVFFAAVYARETLTMRQEALAWIGPWLVAVGLWVSIITGLRAASASAWVGGSVSAVVVASVCYVLWHLIALALRGAAPRRPRRV